MLKTFLSLPLSRVLGVSSTQALAKTLSAISSHSSFNQIKSNITGENPSVCKCWIVRKLDFARFIFSKQVSAKDLEWTRESLVPRDIYVYKYLHWLIASSTSMTQETLRLEQLEVRPRVRDLKAAGCASDLKAQEAGGFIEDTLSWSRADRVEPVRRMS